MLKANRPITDITKINPVKRILYLFIVCVLIATSVHGQRRKKRPQVFAGGLVLGGSLSQIDGDYFTGFDKAGLYAGLRGIINFTHDLSFNMELLYSQKGSKIPHGTVITGNNTENDRLISLNYMEVPLLLKLDLSPATTSPFIEFGGSFSRLLNVNIEEKPAFQINGTVYRDIEQEFRRFDFNAVLGAGYHLDERLELAFRYNFAVSRFYINEDFERQDPFSFLVDEVEFLRNYYMSLALSFKIL